MTEALNGETDKEKEFNNFRIDYNNPNPVSYNTILVNLKGFLKFSVILIRLLTDRRRKINTLVIKALN